MGIREGVQAVTRGRGGGGRFDVDARKKKLVGGPGSGLLIEVVACPPDATSLEVQSLRT